MFIGILCPLGHMFIFPISFLAAPLQQTRHILRCVSLFRRTVTSCTSILTTYNVDCARKASVRRRGFYGPRPTSPLLPGSSNLEVGLFTYLSRQVNTYCATCRPYHELKFFTIIFINLFFKNYTGGVEGAGVCQDNILCVLLTPF